MCKNLWGDVMARITVDMNNVVGQVRPLHGINNAPIIGANDKLFHYLGEAGIPSSRLHDTGGSFGGHVFVDIENIFRNFDADVNDPASYDFAFTDWLLNALHAQGVEPFYRLGCTIENYHYIRPQHILPPKDPQKWAEICAHIVAHYNDGWADGFNLGIRYWEVWNEPDNTPDIKDNPMWKGTMEEYFDLYTIASKHLKARFPHLKIGGYGSCGFYAMNNVDVSQIAHSSSRTDYFIEFFHKFLKHISENDAPMDFFTWHSYAGLKDNVMFASYPRKYLDEYGYKDCEIHLNEWNPCVPLRGTLRDAANILSMMIALHSTPTDMLMYYNFNANSGYCGAVDPLTKNPFKAFYAFHYFGGLYALGNCVECVSDTAKLYALAATDGEKKAVVLCNHSDAPVTVNLSGIKNSATVCITDESHTNEQIYVDPSEIKLDAFAIALIEIQ